MRFYGRRWALPGGDAASRPPRLSPGVSLSLPPASCLCSGASAAFPFAAEKRDFFSKLLPQAAADGGGGASGSAPSGSGGAEAASSLVDDSAAQKPQLDYMKNIIGSIYTTRDLVISADGRILDNGEIGEVNNINFFWGGAGRHFPAHWELTTIPAIICSADRGAGE